MNLSLSVHPHKILWHAFQLSICYTNNIESPFWEKRLPQHQEKRWSHFQRGAKPCLDHWLALAPLLHLKPQEHNLPWLYPSIKSTLSEWKSSLWLVQRYPVDKAAKTAELSEKYASIHNTSIWSRYPMCPTNYHHTDCVANWVLGHPQPLVLVHQQWVIIHNMSKFKSCSITSVAIAVRAQLVSGSNSLFTY